jgi:hypothetical protein
MVAVKGRGIESAIGLGPPVLAEFDHILRHVGNNPFFQRAQAILTAFFGPQRSDCQPMVFVLFSTYIRETNRRKRL